LPELNRLRNILSFSDSFSSNQITIKNSTKKFEIIHETSPRNVEQNMASTNNFEGLMSNQEKYKESIIYIQLSLNTCISLLSSNLVAMQLDISLEGFKLACLGLVQRLRISRLLFLLNLMNDHDVESYLESLDKCESQYLLHNLQSIMSESSVIDRFTYTSFEQVAYGIDTFHTVVKIKRLLKEASSIKSVHICNHRGIGLLLDSYF